MKRIYRTKSIGLLLLIVFCIGLLPSCEEKSRMPKAETSTPSSTVVEETASPTAEAASIPTFKVDNEALTYTTERIVFKDKTNKYASYSLMRDMEVCTVGQRTYYFESVISDADRLERIRLAEKLFERCEIDPELQIYLHTATLPSTYIEEGRVYIRYSSMTEEDYITALLLGAFGAFCNYGMVRGFACFLTGKTPEDIGKLPDDWTYYDLNYLCFRSAFSGKEEATLCEMLALLFTTNYVMEHGELSYLDLLKKSGQPEEAEEARDALKDFYLGYYGVEVDLSPILYAMGGPNYDYLAKCEYACNYVDKRWIDQSAVGYGWRSETHLHENYAEVKDHFELLRYEMHQYQEYFNLYPYRNDLRVYLVGKNTFFEEGGRYENGAHCIFLRTLFLYSHEYVHSITWDYLRSPIIQWQAEGLAAYYEIKYSKYLCELRNYSRDLSNFPDSHWLQLLYEEYGRPFDAEKDWVNECNRLTYFYDDYHLNQSWKFENTYCA